MKLLFKQRVFSLMDKMDIFDEQENVIYTVKGKFALGKKLEVYDAKQNQVALLRQKVMSLKPTFEIIFGDQSFGSVVKEFTLLKPVYTLKSKGWRVEGSFIEYDYSIIGPDGPVASIEKLFGFGDTYEIDVVNDEDALLALMVVIAIDAEKDSRTKDED